MTTVYQWLQGQPEYSQFLNLIELVDQETDSGLVDLLNDPGIPVTVFAPTNDGFVAFAQGYGYAGTDPEEASDFLVSLASLSSPDDPYGLLEGMLSYHISLGSAFGAPLTSSLAAPLTGFFLSLNGEQINLVDGELIDLDVDELNAFVNTLDFGPNFSVYSIDNLMLQSEWFPDASSNTDLIIGAANKDVIRLGEGDDYAAGQGGADDIRTGSGNDIAFGGAGNDEIRGGSDDDYISGDTGNDNLRGDSGDDLILGGNGDDRLDGGWGNDTLSGGNDKDRLNGRGGDDSLNGDGGNDKLYGGTGNDDVNGGSENDALYGDSGRDTLNGDDGNDKIYGGTGRDLLNGGTGNDELKGENGNDTLTGGTGNDTMLGGGGNDTFVFAIGSGVDWVGDFEDGTDTLDVSGMLATDMAGLDFVQHGFDVIVTFETDVSASLTLSNTLIENFGQEDFVFA